MDDLTISAYDSNAAGFAQDWHAQPAPTDLHALIRTYFAPGLTADIGCGSGREVAWLVANGFPACGYDASAGLLDEARARYPGRDFRHAVLPELAGVPEATFDNVLCETVIMHLPAPVVAPSIRRLMGILKSGGTLYLSWRVSDGIDARDSHGRLYATVDSEAVRAALVPSDTLLDAAVASASSGKRIHRIVARKP